jgi:hypothetical protein
MFYFNVDWHDWIIGVSFSRWHLSPNRPVTEFFLGPMIFTVRWGK